jgi:hypothetical protein
MNEKKLKVLVPDDPTNSLLGIHPKKMKSVWLKDIFPPMLLQKYSQ